MQYRFVTNIAEEVKKGNIIYQSEKLDNQKEHINLYIANGLIGACIDSLGSMGNSRGEQSICKTFLSHKYHYTNACYNMEFKVPLATLEYDIVADGKVLSGGDFGIRDYRQELDIYHALLTTEYTLTNEEGPIARIKIIQCMSQEIQNVFLTDYIIEPLNKKPVTLEVSINCIREYISHYQYPYSAKLKHVQYRHLKVLEVENNAVRTQLALLSGSTYNSEVFNDSCSKYIYSISKKEHIRIQAVISSQKDNNSIENLIEQCGNIPYDQHIQRHQSKWEDFWNESILSFGGNHPLMILWLRFNYYFAASEAWFKSVPLTPGGLTGSDCWPFFFPQDYFYMYQFYLSANHKKMADATAVYWYDILPEVKNYTKRVFGVEGAYYPWGCPFFNYAELHTEGVPNKCYYELHNSAYVLWMCYQYYKYSGDIEYLRLYGYPVIREIAAFYSAISSIEHRTGKYQIVFKPNMGQDEMGGINKENYLCTLTSAQYSLETAVEVCNILGITPEETWVQIVDKGYAFSNLVKDGMLYLNSEMQGNDGRQKHPVQLNSLAYLPIRSLYESDEFSRTYFDRYALTHRANENYWYGWTLGEFLLASVRRRDLDEAEKDFGNLLLTSNRKEPYLDKDRIQIYETSGVLNMSYYITTHGLIAQSITEMFVQTYDGGCSIFPALLESIQKSGYEAVFEGIATPFGYTVSGKIENNRCQIIISNQWGTRLRMRIHHIVGRYVLTHSTGVRIVEVQGNEWFETVILPNNEYHIVPLE